MMVKPPSSSSSSSSSKQGQICRVGVSMENHKKDNIPKQEPRLSGAYIRSLVKHLTTSIKSKDSSNGRHDNNLPESVNSNGGCLNDIHNNMQQQSPPPPAPAPPPERPHKKQVRRRQHATKPYQERLLNMAEARREIVTALKFHRASMKQRETTDNNHPQPDQSSIVNSTLSCSPSVSQFWPISTTTPPPLPTLTHENLDFTLPNQTLGLNLNFQDFKNLDKNSYLNYNSMSSSASSSSSSSSSAVISLATEEITAEVPEEVVTATTTSATTTSSSSVTGGLHHAMDEEEMEEIRSLGEQHQMEWDDTVNLLTSARWLKFLKPFEMEQEDWKFDQVMEFPDCMDIGEIEGMDGEWLA
ncbi:hypothetical protein HanRHA438_Chr10g0468941 [Helianthus annuus]|uniref:Putative hydroxyproline-rich glycoprotein family protein n=1 Tax=Helianthus annuus TaxID=4232 RepID=A0A251TMV8_HELAN|nr:uncharacterized protein LOC110886262 [Helianthus annuus]KAF5787711.1 hypothetical protein HanXRQr2_Chr10g0455931 [Helianthus annuus]KAJ0514911.1 hypothetical protein HanHA300_Chr10g0374861 [Helianthus annuus]KAJ0523238.1 hypothetical protein HanIR_Chr10g0491561 [Helianthus annuus]KAJ0531077.1 hypothetical protein HanHA89_Chr10g0397101 [Helianthus annuus]KAJ0701289.1 hypothetical protein HanOQP8_Chr10g0377761 [Helianthus annuus]